jgi:hypothetical protein
MPVPRLLGPSDMPSAELQACALDGDLYAVGDRWTSVAEFSDATVRARVFAEIAREPRLIADRWTAAWIHGARSRTPEPMQACADLRFRANSSVRDRVELRESTLSDGDVVRLAGVGVTSVERTAIDLLRCPGSWTPEHADTVRMLRAMLRDPAVLHARLIATRRAPYSQTALRRLAALDRTPGRGAGDTETPSSPGSTRPAR